MDRFLILITLLILQIPSNAQKKDYIEGYIVTLEQDTLKGWVKDRSTGPFGELYSDIRFKRPSGRLRKKYRPKEVTAYGYQGIAYESISLEQKMSIFALRYMIHPATPKVFLRVVHKNENLSFYHMEYMDGDNGYIDYVPLFHKPNSSEMVRVTQGILGLKKKRLSEYFSDCPDLVQAISNKQLNEPMEVFEFYIRHCVIK